MNRIKNEGIKKIIFVDTVKGERWIFNTKKVFAKMKVQTVGQEEQFYFPIDICKKEKFKPKPEYVFDKERDCYVTKSIVEVEPIEVKVQPTLF